MRTRASAGAVAVALSQATQQRNARGNQLAGFYEYVYDSADSRGGIAGIAKIVARKIQLDWLPVPPST